MRIHVYLAKYSQLSRRKAEALVMKGQVSVNGEIASVGQKVTTHDHITVEGKRITPIETVTRLLALHKPIGYVCSHNPAVKETSVLELLPELNGSKWVFVGRLDINTQGLLLVTNDGKVANQLAHPSNQLLRHYLVRINRKLSATECQQLQRGVLLDDGLAAFKTIKPHGKKTEGRNTWYQVTLTEGRNRIVRRLMESMDVAVSRLIRTGFGPFKLEKTLGVGRYQEINPDWLADYLKNN